ncbi:DUF1684 domain-containing protein [Microbacterium enclense]|uniref:DUF1684 domain-containing protein n=1 Tax=Microbacterium enclense TaxID=993073 RepID=UPI00203C93B5|nr:DUF1684 domain-containing protein [Microbacterium enclense]MCM3613917.1 DUF1684 domain-containing protein [Microbacterium enclense]
MSTDFAQRWERWHTARERSVLAPHGVASLAITAWLTPDARVVDGAEGRWRGDGDRAVGSGLSTAGYRDADGTPIGDEVTLRAGEILTDGERELRAYARDGAPALRVFDPQTASRLRVAGIDAWEPREEWSVTARFEPVDTPREVESVDGHRSFAATTGLLHLVTPDGRERTLDATVGADALSVVFADATSGRESYRFRFLRVDLPDAEGRTRVDFTRAFLPPCAFSDHYVCPLPSARNRLDLAVEAGERVPRLREAADAL